MNLPDNFEVLFTHEQIQSQVIKMAQEIDEHYKDRSYDDPVVCVGVLKGAWIFHADLVRLLKTPVLVDFIRASSYGAGTSSSGVIRIYKDIEVDIRNKDVLLVEEIIDSGRTLEFIKQRLLSGGARSVKIAALLDKKERRETTCEADFVGTIVPNYFVVGYGLDWAEKYRSLSQIYMVK